MGLQVERFELVEADDHTGVIRHQLDLAIRNGVQLEHPVLLGLEVGVVA
jgi:hypothetical protein